MARTAKITLDGAEYVVHALNIDQLERASEAFNAPSTSVAFKVLRIAMERAEPKPNGSLESIEPTFEEINEAFRVIAELSGIKTENPPVAAAKETLN